MARHAFTRIRSVSSSASPGARIPRRPDRRILLIESPARPSVRFRELAMRAGLDVTAASSGPLLPAAARKTSPDLILLSPDVGPPGPSEIARALKQDPETSSIPILHVIDSRRYAELAPYAYPTEAQVADDADDEEIVKTMRVLTQRASRVRFSERPARNAAPLEGDLETETFPEVLQFLFATAKTGRISVDDGRRRGAIFCEAGRVVHAELESTRGLAAFRALCFATHGHFRFEPDAKTSHRSMGHDGIGLLLESARQKDVADRADRAEKVVSEPRADAAEWKRSDRRTRTLPASKIAAPDPRPPKKERPILTASLADADVSARSWISTAGVVALVSVLLLVALGVYAWTGG